MANAIDVANYLIDLALAEEEPEYLTHPRLQKLLYYVQGWSLALRDKAMFEDRIEAWSNGPVVRDVFPVFAAAGSYPITDRSPLANGGIDDHEPLNDEDKELIDAVWNVYKGYSSSFLWQMTHEEPPWRFARGNVAPADQCSSEITKEAMKSFFDTLAAGD